MKKNNQKTRTEIVIDTILEGGYTEDELQEIIDVCETEIENKENENE